MPIRYVVYPEQRLKTVVFFERVTEQEFAEYAKTLRPKEASQYDVVYVDFSQMTECGFGYDSVWPHADRVSHRAPKGLKVTEVFWAPTDIGFGVARMYQSLVEDAVDVKLFRDQADARKALAELVDAIPPAAF